MSRYTTGEVAKLCGVSVRTVQYYDTRGILSPHELTDGGRRLYAEEDLAKMKVICFLKELGLSLGNIAKLMKESNFEKVMDLMLEEQETLLAEEIADKEAKLEKVKEVRRALKKASQVTVESFGDIANIMEHKKKLRKVRLVMILSSIPLGILQWGGVALWIATGIWWPFVAWLVVMIPFAIWISRYYFKNVAYICPECHEIFQPRFKEAFWANHTPNTRKLTCPKCGKKSFCVETHRSALDEQKGKEN